MNHIKSIKLFTENQELDDINFTQEVFRLFGEYKYLSDRYSNDYELGSLLRKKIHQEDYSEGIFRIILKEFPNDYDLGRYCRMYNSIPLIFPIILTAMKLFKELDLTS